MLPHSHRVMQINKRSPDYPVLTSEQRRANPAVRVPCCLVHPITGKRSIYGVNSSTCAVVSKGSGAIPESEVSRERATVYTSGRHRSLARFDRRSSFFSSHNGSL